MAQDAKTSAGGAAGEQGEDRRYIRFELVDFNCKALSKTVPERHRSSPIYMYGGATANGANSEVLTFPDEIAAAGCPNFAMVPDWATLQALPWAKRPGVQVSRVYCEQLAGSRKGAPKNETLPRTVCKKLLEELHGFEGRGLSLLTGGELEFTVVKRGSGNQWVPLFDGVDVFATLQNTKGMDFCYQVERDMEAVGVDIMTMNAEYGEGQIEIAFAPKFGIEGADQQATFRTGTKEIAQQLGYLATFMSKPFGVAGVGNGGHFNFSLWEGGAKDTKDAETADAGVVHRTVAGRTNALHSQNDPEGMSSTAKHFLAGVLAHAPALEAICSPTEPCYCRHGNWAPTMADWGMDNRNAAVRVKSDKDSDASNCYMELRLPSSSANPYLVMAASVAAGLDGLQRKLELPAQVQTKEDGGQELPLNLEASLKALEADTYMVEKLGADFVRWFTGVKRAEIAYIEAMLEKGEKTDNEMSAAWQHMYMEYL